MARILIAEDSRTQAAHLCQLLEREGHQVHHAENGRSAFDAVSVQNPELLLTDLVMPEMTGLQLIEACAAEFPVLPTILMTDFGSEEVAAEALQKGAVSYIPKRRLEQDLLKTLAGVLGLTRIDRKNMALQAGCTRLVSEFELENEPAILPNLVAHLRELMATMGICDEKGLTRVCIALTEAVDNALHHGNLELSSSLREGDGSAWRQTGADRRKSSPYKERRIRVQADVDRQRARIVIRDEGPGFDVSKLPDPTDPEYLEQCSGRGVLLMRSFMDEVTYNAKGNVLTLIKLRQQSK